MAGMPRSMVSLASQRSSRTTSAPTANGHDSPRPRTDIARGAGPGSRSHAGQLPAAKPIWPGTAPVLGHHQDGRRAQRHPSPPSCTIISMWAPTGPPDMGRTSPAARDLRPYRIGPDWANLRTVRMQHSPGRRGPMTSPTIFATKHRGPLSRIARRWRLLPRPHHRRKATPPSTGPAFRKVWTEVALGQWQWKYIKDEADQK